MRKNENFACKKKKWKFMKNKNETNADFRVFLNLIYFTSNMSKYIIVDENPEW